MAHRPPTVDLLSRSLETSTDPGRGPGGEHPCDFPRPRAVAASTALREMEPPLRHRRLRAAFPLCSVATVQSPRPQLQPLVLPQLGHL